MVQQSGLKQDKRGIALGVANNRSIAHLETTVDKFSKTMLISCYSLTAIA